MKGTNLGEFEELVMLLTTALKQEAYSVNIVDELKAKTKRSPALSVVHTALHRLEEKGFLKSKLMGGTKERGGRRKRVFATTRKGMLALEIARNQREELWQMIGETQVIR